jgi:hypothetical protein
VTALFAGLLDRDPTPAEHEKVSESLRLRGDFFEPFAKIMASREYHDRRRVKTAWVPGHFYSPVVDPETVRNYVTKARLTKWFEVAGIDLAIPEMEAFWTASAPFLAATPFTSEPADSLRYYWRDSPYPIGDAVTYRAVINAARPRRIVEVGSGFSTACALDTLDEIGLDLTQLTCIEPFPAALLRRLRASDHGRVTILESMVQDVPTHVFEALEANDILFIDSTHVLKTGSDVHFEFFSVLPILKPGVLVHFHDIRWPFEYPHEFIFDRNFSWNEAYALRAFLMYNNKFSVIFYNSLFAAHHEALIRRTLPSFMINPGSSIWLRVNE